MVLALSVLIVFLFKKSNELREMIAANEQAKINQKMAKLSRMSPYALKFLERLMQKFKLASLKFYNHSDQWFQSLKQKREKRQEQNRQAKQMEIAQMRKAEFEMADRNEFSRNRVEAREAGNNENETRKNKLESFFRRTKKIDPIGNYEERKPRRIYPIISKKIVQPEKKVKENMLEEILIERIAINPRDIEAYERLGDYYIENNNLSDSLECFKQVVKLSPANRKAKLNVRKIEEILAK
jgi:hypothetical protein